MDPYGCPFCGTQSPVGTVYRDATDSDYRAVECQCGLWSGDFEHACGSRFRVQTDGDKCLGVDDICVDPEHDRGDGLCKLAHTTPADEY